MDGITDQQLVDYIQHSSAAIEQAAAIHTADETRRSKIASYKPAAVDAVLATGIVGSGDRDALTARFDDHGFTLQMLHKVAAELQLLKAERLAEPRVLGGNAGSGRKSLKAAGAAEPFYGGQRVKTARASDTNWEAGLGYR